MNIPMCVIKISTVVYGKTFVPFTDHISHWWKGCSSSSYDTVNQSISWWDVIKTDWMRLSLVVRFSFEDYRLRIMVSILFLYINWQQFAKKNSVSDFNHIHILLFLGSRPSDHYFRSVCLFVCLFVQSFSQPSLIWFRSNLDICYNSGSSCVP